MQTKTDIENIAPATDEEENYSFRLTIQHWKESVLFAFKSWRAILAFSIITGLLGLGYSWYKKATYTARLTFVVEDAKSSGGSIASALAGQFGLDIGGLSGTNGVLAGDNVMELLKSRSLLKKTLLSSYYDTSDISIADQYAEVYHWKDKWQNSNNGKNVRFPVNQVYFSRMEDSLLQKLITRIEENELVISKPDKKLGFFELEVSTREEKISQLICERLLKNATEFYIDTKTKRLKNNVARLQQRADSLGILLDKRTYSAAEANQLLLDANPAYSSPTVGAEISTRNKYIQGTVYAEIVKNLEISKTSLIQETPTVQIVDAPELPLRKNQLTCYLAVFIGFIAGCMGATLFFAFQKK